MRRRTQRGQILRIGDGWYVRYWQSMPQDGVLVRKRKTHCLGAAEGRSRNPPAEIESEAAKYMANVVNDCGPASIPAAHAVTFKVFVETVFLPWAKMYKRPSTYKSYNDAWNNHLKAVAGRETITLKDLQTYHVQAWIEKIAQENMARNSLRHLRSALSGIFTLAKKRGYRKDSNPLREAELPPTPEPAEMHAYSLEDEEKIMSLLPEPAATVFAIASYTGLRIGEITGLNWEDFTASQLRVRRSIWSGITQEPKTKNSAANVPVIRRLSERLEMHRLRCGEPKSGPMFRNYRGERLNLPNLVHYSILPALNRCAVCGRVEGIKHLKEAHDYKRDERIPVWHGWHAARRGLATNLCRMGVPLVVVQRILRHKKVETTAKFYVKIDDQDTTLAMANFEQNLDKKIAIETLPDTQRTLTVGTLPGSGAVN